jgi:O-succinylbenzoic acid--CoA ligase
VPAAGEGRLFALDLPPGEAFLEALDGAWARGDAVLPIDPRGARPAVEQMLAAMRPTEPVQAGTAVVIGTSGSTGRPKGVVLSHAALDASARATMARIGVEAGDGWLSCLPWHHIAGLQVALRARRFGLPLVVHERFDVERVAAEAAVTLVSLVPTQLARLLDAGVDLSRFRVVLLGGAAAWPALLDRARAAGAPIVTTYGMTETCGGCVYDGVPLDGVEVRIERDGRVGLRGPMMMSGYRLDERRTDDALRDGWLRTTDLGSWHGERLVVHGRVDDVVITGGENVVATEVAAVLADHPSVREAAVVGVPDPEWGHAVVAVVVPAGAAAPPLSELRSWVSSRMSAAAAPRRLVVVAAIPRLPSGKPDRNALVAVTGGGADVAGSGCAGAQ